MVQSNRKAIVSSTFAKLSAISSYYKWTSSVLLLAVGIGIYILYRPTNILVFNLLQDIGLLKIVDSLRFHASKILLPSFVINSLPSGLWMASYLIAMYLTTKGMSRNKKIIMSIPLPVTAIILEFFQLFGWCSGTFDLYDLICYVIPIIIFIKSI